VKKNDIYVGYGGSGKVLVIDLKTDKTKTFKVEGVNISVCRKVLEIEYMINMPVLKGHSQTLMTGALKNYKGCIPDREKKRFHSIGLHKPIALLNKIIKTDLVIVDGIIGDLSSEIGGNPVNTYRILIAKDPVLVDSYVAELMGISTEELYHVKYANEIGIGSIDTANAEVIEINRSEDVPDIEANIISFPDIVVSCQACSACHGGLMHALTRVKEKGKINSISGKIYVGQAFKNRNIDGIGVGDCTSGFSRYVKGCPPSAKDILWLLRT